MHGISKIANQISSDVNFAEYIERMDSLLDINFDVQVESVE